MSLEHAAEKGCQESVTVKLAKCMGTLSPSEIEALYKMGFVDGALHAATEFGSVIAREEA